MADRYWVGGTGNWNSTTKWSTSSGGASGASVPTSSDNAIFDANSGTAHFTVTVTDNATCADLTITPEPANGVTQFAVGVNFVIAGTFSTSGTQGNRRLWFRSSTFGLMRDMNIATIGTVTDVDFQDIRITGSGGTLTGTRIGNLGGNKNITFSLPKTVYWVTAGGGNWSGDNWSDTSGGAASTDYFPLAQDIAVIENTGLNTSATVTLDAAFGFVGNVDMSTRTNAATILFGANNYSLYGDWSSGTGTALGWGANTWSTFFRKRGGTQNITSNGRGWFIMNVDSIDGTVKLLDNFSCGAQFRTAFTLTSGTLDLNGKTLTGTYNSNQVQFLISTGKSELIFNGGTLDLRSNFPLTNSSGGNCTITAGPGGNGTILTGAVTAGIPTFAGGNANYPCSFVITNNNGAIITGDNTFVNITVNPPSAGAIKYLSFGGDQTITDTFTCAGSGATGRVLVYSNVVGTQRTLTVNTLLASDCDFRDIAISGSAAGSSPTRAGDVGGNSGITFPSPKTVYWNLAGTQTWQATAWASSSGGTPDVNNFPLVQDTAVFDDAGSAGTVTMWGWYVGTVDMSARTTAMTLTSGAPIVLGDWKWGTGVTSTSNTSAITFAKRGTQTITSNGVTFGSPVTINGLNNVTKVELADALTLNSARSLSLTAGEFDAISYSVTAGIFASSANTILKMGSGTWTLSGTGTLWSNASTYSYAGTADIVLSDTSTTARTFAGGSKSYNKLTIGGATGTSTTTITGNNFFAELASTKTVAHTIALGSTTQIIDTWTVSGTAGNIATVTGSASVRIAGFGTSGIDYLALGTITSPGVNFFAGVNSTGTGAGVFLTANPGAGTRYWVGGSGTWNATTTTNWSASSGGAGGASVPTATDSVVFDQAATYTVTMSGVIACADLTVSAGTVTFNVNNSPSITVSGSMLLLASTIWSVVSGGAFQTLTFSSKSSGNTITTNGSIVASRTTLFAGIGGEWTLGSAYAQTNGITFDQIVITAGIINTNGYNFSNATLSGAGSNFAVNNGNAVLNLGASNISTAYFTHSDGVINAQSGTINISNNNSAAATFSGGTFNAGTSTFRLTGGTLNTNGINAIIPVTFYTLAITNNINYVLLAGNYTITNLNVTGRSSAGYGSVSFTANCTITNLNITGGSVSSRYFIYSSTTGTPVTIACATTNLTDVDFRDIFISGAAVPVSGTRIGDAKGNSGFNFISKTVYWNLAGNQNWESAGWALTSNGTPNVNNFPMPQDTAIFTDAGSVTGTITLGGWLVGTIDMSARTSAMTLLTTAPTIIGDWINGSGTTLSGTGVITFSGRGSQQITSAGKTWTQLLAINSIGGSIALQDAFTASQSSASVLTVTSGTFNANGYNVTLSGAASAVSSSNSNIRTIAIGSGEWTLAGTGGWNTTTSTGLTVTGTGTISLTSASAKTFAGGGTDYSGITLNQGGAGTLSVTGNNTFKTITNTYGTTGATTLNFGTTTQRITDPWTASGSAGNILTVQGASSTSPCTLIFTGSGVAADVDYLTITGVRAYPTATSWYAGTNSSNNGSLGWGFSSAAPSSVTYKFFMMF